MTSELITNRPSIDCLVIGAGIAGLLAATTLTHAGFHVRVLEKSRGVGGRMATRRRDGAVFDHGAQFFTVRNERFHRWVDEWQTLGLIASWYQYGDSGVHYKALGGMTAIAKHLAKDLIIEREVLVERLTLQAHTWQIHTAGGVTLEAPYLALTAPVPQAMALLDRSSVRLDEGVDHALRSITFHRCIAAMAILDRPSAITNHSGALKLTGEPILWISDNHRKGISPSVPSITIHSTPSFAESHWDTDDSVRIPKLLEAASSYVQAEVVSYQGHRWGFSQPIGSYHQDAFIDAEKRLAIAGDGLAGGRVEGAALSGLAAGEGLIRLMSEP